ncbi:MAG: glycosyltransferase, partial [Campylobacter curvus]
DHYIANSRYVARRIKKVYGKDSAVIYPPVDTAKFELKERKDDFYLTASRMVPYKKIDLVVDVFSKSGKRLVVIGDGPDMAKVKSKAAKNIEILGYQNDDVMRETMQKAKAFVFAAEEDFGITPVEAQACGTPVICLGKGGAKETIADMVTGVHFSEQNLPNLLDAVDKFEKNIEIFEPSKIRLHALKFSKERFEREIKEFVEEKYKNFKERLSV